MIVHHLTRFYDCIYGIETPFSVMSIYKKLACELRVGMSKYNPKPISPKTEDLFRVNDLCI